MTAQELKQKRYELSRRLRKICEQKGQLKLKIEFYNDLIKDFTPYKSPQMEDTKIITSMKSDNTYKGVVKLEKYRNQMISLQKELDENIEMFDSLISLLGERERIILICKYLYAKHWQEIAKELNYYERHLRRIHTNALDKIIRHEVEKHDRQ